MKKIKVRKTPVATAVCKRVREMCFALNNAIMSTEIGENVKSTMSGKARCHERSLDLLTFESLFVSQLCLHMKHTREKNSEERRMRKSREEVEI